MTRAAQLMLQHRISGLPVVDAKGSLVGMVTEGDFLRRGELGTERKRPRWLEFLLGPGKLATEYVQARGQKVGEINGRLNTRSGEPPPGTDSRGLVRLGARYTISGWRADAAILFGVTSHDPHFGFAGGATYVFHGFQVP